MTSSFSRCRDNQHKASTNSVYMNSYDDTQQCNIMVKKDGRSSQDSKMGPLNSSQMLLPTEPQPLKQMIFISSTCGLDLLKLGWLTLLGKY